MFDEETLERVTMEMLHELEYEVINGYELVRTDFSNVLLEEDIIQAIERINKGIKDDQVKEALRLIRNLDHNNTILNNKQFTKYLLEGIAVPTQENGETKYLPYAPLNAVATVDWVIAYASLAPGQQAGFDPDSFARKKDLEEINLKISDHERRIEKNTTNISINAENIRINKEAIEALRKYTDGLHEGINNRLTTAEKTVKDHENRITSIESDPFPNGLWLVCGDTVVQ